MQSYVFAECLIIALAPLVASIIAGLLGNVIGRKGAHRITILGVAISFFVSILMAKQMIWDHSIPERIDMTWYHWATIGALKFQVGFYIDHLTLLMMCVVSFVSWMVHIYTIGYMADDSGYQRFFSYIALFTFAMLMLVMSNNFLQLFFGWEAVGVVSYLLIGFYFKKDSAIFASLKAFLANRVGDLGFLLGIAVVVWAFGSLDYQTVFKAAPALAAQNPVVEVFNGYPWSLFTIMCILLFIGAMGKSAQVPLHVWLPDSMEGPTPISALIHAATMVTAGVFMVARCSPLFEYSETALGFVLFIGSFTCLFMGLVGIVQNDIKRIIAYSTLSQLGYMVAALGVSAYSIGIFHLMTHAFFKALLFLGAGSVIIAMHHDQDIRNMGGLRKYMPITYITMLVGSLALAGIPFFSGFYSKDLIIEAVHLSTLPLSTISYWAVLGSVMVTALYTFRLFFVVFHTKPRMNAETKKHLKESPWVVCLPLVMLAIPAAGIGAVMVAPILDGYLRQSLFILPEHDVVAKLAADFHGPLEMGLHGLVSAPFFFALAGIFVTWLCYIKVPSLPEKIAKRFSIIYTILVDKYGFDAFNQIVFAHGTRALGWLCWRGGDRLLIDGLMVNGSAKSVGYLSRVLRQFQTGHVYQYAFAMVAGVILLAIWLMVKN